jgi:hypothetical protein
VGDTQEDVQAKLKTFLTKNFNGTGFVNPGSNTFTLANSATDTLGNLTKNDVLVFGEGGGVYN